MVLTWVFKKQFPFIRIFSIPKTQIEITFDNAQKVQNLMFALIPIMITVTVIKFLRGIKNV